MTRREFVECPKCKDANARRVGDAIACVRCALKALDSLSGEDRDKLLPLFAPYFEVVRTDGETTH